MTSYDSENQLVRNIRARFPDETVLTDQYLIDRGWDPSEQGETPYIWVEAFAGHITEAIRRNDMTAIEEQTGFLAYQYRANPDRLRTFIDVAYAENIVWNVTSDEKSSAWKHVASEIQQLYAEMWGSPCE